MHQDIHRNFILTFTLSVSFFGLFITLMLALFPSTTQENFFWRKPFVGLVFSLVCVLGMFAAFSPKQCSEAFHFRKAKKNLTPNTVSVTSKGHHPDCERFSAHVIRLSNHTLCAACTGLFVGAFIALVGTAFYFFDGWHIGEMGFPSILIGVVGVILGFLQIKSRGFIRLMLNTLFVAGAFLILVGIDELTQSLFVDLFLITIIVFWLLTRIMLSQWDHWRTCHHCESPCEICKS